MTAIKIVHVQVKIDQKFKSRLALAYLCRFKEQMLGYINCVLNIDLLKYTIIDY